VAPVCTLGSLRAARGRILRGVLAAVTGLSSLIVSASDADAYAIKRTSRGDLVHWEERTVKYTIDPSLDRNVARGTEATVAAMKSWSGTVGAPELASESGDDSSPKSPGFDQKNGVFFKKSGYAPAGRALAITVLTYDNTTGRILDADVIFNGSYNFEVLEAPTEAMKRAATTHITNTDGVMHEEEVAARSRDAVYDLHHVIAHELGHSLGLNDEMGRKDALMYRYSAPNDASVREPSSDDIAGLAELYGTEIEARGNGCGGATVAPKKPSHTASHAAMLATLGLLGFVVVRAKSDRRARIGFVLAAATATIALVPSLSGGKDGGGVAQASESIRMLGHARAKVLATSTSIEKGLFKTTYRLATSHCRTNACPKAGHGVAWGGTIGSITQEVGGYYAPVPGDEVDVSFETLPDTVGSLTKPLAGRAAERSVGVRVVTPRIVR
jgi:hypothetical protein